MTNLGSILKSRDIALPTKVCLPKAMVFPIVMYGYESWTVNKAEQQRIDAFELWCWRIFLDSKEIQPVHPKGNQSWVFIGRTDAEAEPPILWPPDAKNWLTRKDPDAGEDWGQEKGTTGLDGWMASLTQWTWVWVSSGSWWWTENPGVLQSTELPRVRHDWATELNWIAKMGLPGCSVVKNPHASAGDAADVGSIPRLKKDGNPLQYSHLGNLMDREAWWATVYQFAKNLSQLSSKITTA